MTDYYGIRKIPSPAHLLMYLSIIRFMIYFYRVGLIESASKKVHEKVKKERIDVSSSKFSGISLQDTNFLEEMTPFLTNYRCLDTVFRLNYVIFLFLQKRLQRKEKGRNNSIVSLQIFISRISFESIHGKWERKKFQSTPVSSTISNPHLKSPLSPFASLRRFFT